jgi:hypothetical protein
MVNYAVRTREVINNDSERGFIARKVMCADILDTNPKEREMANINIDLSVAWIGAPEKEGLEIEILSLNHTGR